jgi:hypothetical protein
MEIKITYTGTVVSADEIKFIRNVADFAPRSWLRRG